jgi:antitoxin component of MazEF toxin-antitoxin module
MGHPTKVQLIRRQASTQWYVNLPAAVARALELEKGEVVEWIIQDQHHLVLKRVEAVKTAAAGKKKR